MRTAKLLLAGAALQALLATPAWAHPAARPHLHPEELIALAVLAILTAAAALRLRSPRR